MPTIVDFPLDSTRFFLISPPEGVDAPGLEVAIRTDGQGVGLRVHGQEEIGFALSGPAARALSILLDHGKIPPYYATIAKAHIEEITMLSDEEPINNDDDNNDDFSLAT